MGYHQWKTYIEACLKCASVCNYCASECTKEPDIKMMAKCIELDMPCASICYSAGQLMSMGSEHAVQVFGVSARICQLCGEQGAKHENDHCRQCAETCKACAEECSIMAA